MNRNVTPAELLPELLHRTTNYRIYDCKVMDAEGNLKYIVTAEAQVEEKLRALKRRLLQLLEEDG
jgi:hypothetical protein